MDHEDKKKLARKHLTHQEIKGKKSVFQSEWWENRKAMISKKVQLIIKKQKAKKLNKSKV